MAKPEEKTKKVKKPTALKRDLQNEKRRLINRAFKANIRTVTRKFETNLQSGDADAIKTSLNDVYSVMDKAVSKGIYNKNKASRSKARLTARAVAS